MLWFLLSQPTEHFWAVNKTTPEDAILETIIHNFYHFLLFYTPNNLSISEDNNLQWIDGQLQPEQRQTHRQQQLLPRRPRLSSSRRVRRRH